MKKSLFTSLIMVSMLTLAACTGIRGNETAQNNNAPATSPTTSPEASSAVPNPLSGSSPSPSPQAASPSPDDVEASEIAETYEEKDGLFQIGFPEGYTHQETGSGVAFVSADQHFGGSVDFGSAQGQQLNIQQLEAALKQEYEQRLTDITWQGSEEQPDGSIRVDWVGKDQDGNSLDAISFVEQRGDTIFILNLFGINKAYQDYNADAKAIVSSYRVQQN